MGGAPWKGRRQDEGAGTDGMDSPEDGRAQRGRSETGCGDNKRTTTRGELREGDSKGDGQRHHIETVEEVV